MQLRRHQVGALTAVEQAWVAGLDRALVVLPPGAGKTLVGIEAVRRLVAAGDVAGGVVLGPNTAIQGQWVDQATRAGVAAGTHRDLAATLTALTYQSVAVFRPPEDPEDPEDPVDPEDPDGSERDAARRPATPGGLLAELHENGAALVERLRRVGPVLLVLDECHHLVEVWGRLLQELLDALPQARVLALTATPPETLTREQAALVDDILGPPVYAASIPAVVRDGDLAPFAELVWLTEPTPTERDWLAEGAVRFRELTTALTDPGFGDPAFLSWADRRFVDRPGGVGWPALYREQPDLCAAALRLHHAALLALPPGANVQEDHRRDPDADDWMRLVSAWLHEQAEGPGREAVEQAVRRALPAVGFVWTRRGIRRGRSPVDRVLARSEAKTAAAARIVGVEAGELGEDRRVLVLCDHERASATVPADLDGVLRPQAGSALAVLDALLAEGPDGPGHDALLVTGSTVAGAPASLGALVDHVRAGDPGLAETLRVVPGEGTGHHRIEGPWRSRRWVREVTAFFEAGGCHTLVGTRGLLGEGWDARRVTTLVDLTAITTSTAVVQTRGRALRTDPGRPDKVALNWSVVCVAPEHPRGDNDWRRLVRKHSGFYGVDEDGDVVDGVSHLDPAFSPFAPPAPTSLGAVNARMQLRAQGRAGIRERWQVGTAYDDRPAVTLRVRPDRVRPPGRRATPPLAVQRADRVVDRSGGRGRPVGAALAVAALVLGVLLPGAWWPALAVALLAAGLDAVRLGTRGARLLRHAAEPPSVDQVARAVADALQQAGEAPVGASAVRVVVDREGTYRCVLDDVDLPTSARFATALDEVLSPLVAPRYVVPRWVVLPDQLGSPAARARVGLGLRQRPGGEVWHAVPTLLGTNAQRARVFAKAWDRWVGGGAPVYTGSPEGAGVLAAQAGADPLAVTTTVRRTWR